MTDAEQKIDLDKAIDAIGETGVEKGLEKFLNDAEFQTVLVREICEQFDELNPRLVRFVLKRLAPLVAKAGGTSVGWLGDLAKQRLIQALEKIPVTTKIVNALETVLTKADLAQRGETEIAAIRAGELNPDEAAHLKFLSADLSRHAEIISDLADIKDAIAQLSNPQPTLNLDIIKDETGQNRFYYGARHVPFQGRQDELAALEAFLNDAQMVSWHMMLGAGGQGKSRLALELCLQMGGAWRTGFLKEDTTFATWETWAPDQPTLIVVDYVARRGEAIGKIIRHAARNKNEFVFPVRFLLLERGLSDEDEWFKNLRGSGGSDQAIFDGAGHPQPAIDLPNPGADELWTIMTAMNAKLDAERKDECLDKLGTIDTESRPLYAAFLAEALSENDDALHWDTTELARTILERDQAKFWPKDISQEDKQKDKNLLALATMCGGWPVDALEGLEDPNLLPSPDEEAVYQRQAAMTGHPVSENFPPLEPDLLGELFVLETLKYPKDCAAIHPARVRHDALRILAWHAAPGSMFDFLIRCARDFPLHDTLKTLSMPLDGPDVPPHIAASGFNAIARMSNHLGRAGAADLVLQYSTAVRNGFKHEQLFIKAAAAKSAAGIFYGLYDTQQRDATLAMTDELSALTEEHPDAAEIHASYALLLLAITSTLVGKGADIQAETMLKHCLAVAQRFPDHKIARMVQTNAQKVQEFLDNHKK